jgi:hypothetical protein
MAYSSGGMRNALVGISGAQQVTNNLQPQQMPYRPPMMYPGMGQQNQPPMMYQPMPNQVSPVLPTPMAWLAQQHQSPMGWMGQHQRPNPHAGAYQEWMQQFAGPRGRQTLTR